MSNKETLQVSGEVVELSDTPTKSKEEVYEEIKQTFILLASAAPIPMRIVLIKVMMLMVELVHWQHDSSGKHPSPSEMIELGMTDGGVAETGAGPKAPLKFDA